MKATGIVRRVDGLERIAIPKNQKNPAYSGGMHWLSPGENAPRPFVFICGVPGSMLQQNSATPAQAGR